MLRRSCITSAPAGGSDPTVPDGLVLAANVRATHALPASVFYATQEALSERLDHGHPQAFVAVD
jgi:hypothetical protein